MHFKVYWCVKTPEVCQYLPISTVCVTLPSSALNQPPGLSHRRTQHCSTQLHSLLRNYISNSVHLSPIQLRPTLLNSTKFKLDVIFLVYPPRTRAIMSLEFTIYAYLWFTHEGIQSSLDANTTWQSLTLLTCYWSGQTRVPSVSSHLNRHS